MADFIFNQYMNQFFGSTSGAFSEVTEREVFDSQITVTSNEKPLFLKYFKNIPRGSVSSLAQRGVPCSFAFKLYPTGEEILLNINYPKENKNELRLYLQKALFKPAPDLTWFVFEKDKQIWIGALDGLSIQAIRSGVTITAGQKALIDFSDVEYQSSVQKEEPAEQIEQTIRRIKRNPIVARTALDRSGYKCEIFPKLPLFTSKSTGRPYLEAHHLIPIGFQPMFDTNLDVIENICILNPYAHRMVHHATYSEIEHHIQALSERRQDFLNALGINSKKVESIYSGVE